VNLERVKMEVDEVSQMSADNEKAHALEDSLYHSFVTHVAIHGPSDLSEMAREILRTEDMDFARWYA
jgi:hypothetical protein